MMRISTVSRLLHNPQTDENESRPTIPSQPNPGARDRRGGREAGPEAAADVLRSLTEQEVVRLFGSIEGQDRLFFRLLILCGARLGEVLALRREDVQGGEVRLTASALYGKRGPTKNRKTRTVPIPHSLQTEIERWLASRSDDNPLVFPSRRGTILRREGYPLWALERARKATGIQDLDYHMTRRTFATLYEGDMADVQDILGHAGPGVTMKFYKKPVLNRQRKAVEALDRRVSGRKADVVSIRRAG